MGGARGMSGSRKHLLIITLVVIVLLGTATGYASGYFNYLSAPFLEIVEGVSVGPVYVGGMNKEEALKKIKVWSDKALSQVISLSYGDRRWEMTLADLGVELDLEKAIDEAAMVGHQGNPWERFQEYTNVKEEGRQITLHYRIDVARIASIIAERTRELTTGPVNAALTINERDELIITHDQPGSKVDSQAAAQEIKSILEKGVKEPLDQTWTVRLTKVDMPAEITEADVQSWRINGLLSSYSTKFNASNINRTYNVKVAAEALNHQRIKPGEIFSFNQVVGPRSEEAGYKEALIIVKNEFVPGLGGGVCQVSSTLYNAVLLADLPVVERSNHSLPVDYVPPGRDATVTYGGKNLRFSNPTEGDLLLQTKVQGNTLTIQIFGDKQFRKDVSLTHKVISFIEPGVIKKPNPELPEGEEVIEQAGTAGLRVQVYRTVKEQGKVVRNELISTDVYNPVARIVQVGTKKEGEEPSSPVQQNPPGIEPGTDPQAETKPGADSETEPGTDSETKPGADPETEPGADPETEPGTDSETKPGADPETKPGVDPETEPVANPETTDPGIQSEVTPETTPEKAPEDNLNLGTNSETSSGVTS
jgi:vancomycin resistance protein YoaR